MTTPVSGEPYTDPSGLDDLTAQVQQDRVDAPEELAQQIADSAAMADAFVELTDVNQVFMQGHAFMLNAGAAALSSVGGSPVWALDQTSVESVAGSVRLPSWWATFDIYYLWANAGAGAGDVSLQIVRSLVTTGDDISAGGGATSTKVTATAGAQYILQTTLHTSGITNDPTKTWRFRPGRSAGDAADTLANDIYLVGLLLQRAS